MESLTSDAALANMETDILSNTGQFRAKVLYAWQEEVEGDSESFWGNINREAPKVIVKVKARILIDESPVHHFTLPEPRVLPLPNTEDPNNARGVDWPAINQHPTYVAKHIGLPLPNPGDIIYVGYSNTGNGGPDGVGTDPIYISPAENQGIANLGEMIGGAGGNPYAAFNGPLKQALGTLGGPAFDPSKGTIVELVRSIPFKENRVRMFSFGTISPNSRLLVNVPSTRPRNNIRSKLHVLAAARFNAMNEAFKREMKGHIPDNQLSVGFKVQSGTRPPKYKTDQQYFRAVVRKYRGEAWSKGKTDKQIFNRYSKWIARHSPHQTGLAMDLRFKEGNVTMAPVSATAAAQKKMKAYRWLVAHAHRFGITPLGFEPWHWEVLIPRASWFSGEEFTKDYNVRVVETSTTPYPENFRNHKGVPFKVQGQKLTTDSKVFAFREFV